ncbi:hypothetical protein AURDEDRAFT_110754 [Auricularia subglabra TFB-10046 SS5]|nr:hypothetical protein AURDEDRAFT_110754 [Auricularia subglabra TFB-10046 SS5]
MADDLADDYIADGTLAVSDNEDSGLESSGEDEPGASASAQLSAAAKKRKRREQDKQKKATKRRKFAESAAKATPHAAIAFQSPAILAKTLASVQAKVFKDASAIELEELAIPETCIEDTSSFTEERSLENLCQFVDAALPQLRVRMGQKSKTNGAPTLIFVTSAAMRGADVIRELRKLQTDKSGQVAKLFAKHLKVEDQVAYLRRTKVVAAVGTPGRLGKLLEENDCLSLDALSHVMIDFTHRDLKSRSVVDIPETRQELFKTVLGNERLMNAFRSGKVKLVLF